MNSLFSKLTFALILSLVISACGGPSKTIEEVAPVDPIQPGSSEAEILAAFELESNESWLDAANAYRTMAEKSAQPDRSSFYIRSALMLYKDERYLAISPFFESLKSDDILDHDQAYKQVILAGGYNGAGKSHQSLLTLPEIGSVIDHRFKVLALEIRSKAVLAIGKPFESATLRMQISQHLKTDEEREQNHSFIWEALNRIDEPSILKALNESPSSEVRGWLELNLIVRRSNMLPAKMEPWLGQWYQLFAGHPAGPIFASDLLKESKRIFIRPTKITLMLPFSGRLARVSEAIQNGFMYAHYQYNEDAASLEIVNASDDPAEFMLQYEQVIQNGAEFIVGPISKDLINILQTKDQLDVPTLALNYGDIIERTAQDLYQFGLGPEDEAEQIADYTIAGNKSSAITLVPDTEWGGRLQETFTNRFESLGGQVVGAATYPSRNNDYSETIKQLLNLTSSTQRHKILQQVVGENLEFIARRRQDVDMIFIAANARQARLIKPQLKFHHAQDVPVYATSHIASSTPNANDDRDLDEIRFVDIPWRLNQADSADFQQVKALWPLNSGRFGRLFALGIDAYRLIPSLRRLMVQPEESLDYHTGNLTVDSDGRVHRQLLFATYKKGLAKALIPEETAIIEPEAILTE